jgi:hypothetical protein
MQVKNVAEKSDGVLTQRSTRRASALAAATQHEKSAKRLILWKNLVRLAGIEPTTLGFGGQYSIH